ncbi:hypothetical protein PR001_g23031 [Phytophthora rubi]|uniref:Uncharacterized protein n=1 Tax=Phytophthora rubi TaxID=129364 RepID=A0A6A3IPR0_9STRA|nr:hypothetical protein PR001_g23031 [Phytophthora rubi]
MMLFDMAKLMLCEVLLLLIYPPYYHLFTTLPETSQTVYTLLLPVIKLLMRNLFARAVRHLGDETPELVVFNADTFGSLFVSYCMQSSPSIWSTIVIIAADAVLIGLCLRDIVRCREGLHELESEIELGPIWRRCSETLGFKLLGDRKPTTLERANILLELGEPGHLRNLQSGDSRVAKILPLESSQLRPGSNAGELGIISVGGGSEASSRDFAFFSFISRALTPWMGWRTVYPERTGNTRAQRRSPSTQIRLKYMLKVRRLLYMAEFLLLLNYIEGIIPQSFAIYLVTTYFLPNREYYAIFQDMNESQLYGMLWRLLVYWFLQLLSLLCLNMLLQRILGLSPVRLLAFVLENQVDFVQIHLTYWLCYNAQCTLEHIGNCVFHCNSTHCVS